MREGQMQDYVTDTQHYYTNAMQCYISPKTSAIVTHASVGPGLALTRQHTLPVCISWVVEPDRACVSV